MSILQDFLNPTMTTSRRVERWMDLGGLERGKGVIRESLGRVAVRSNEHRLEVRIPEGQTLTCYYAIKRPISTDVGQPSLAAMPSSGPFPLTLDNFPGLTKNCYLTNLLPYPEMPFPIEFYLLLFRHCDRK